MDLTLSFCNNEIEINHYTIDTSSNQNKVTISLVGFNKCLEMETSKWHKLIAGAEKQ